MNIFSKKIATLGLFALGFCECSNQVDFRNKELGVGGATGRMPTDIVPPAHLSASEADFADKIEIRWSPVAAGSYKLYRKLEGQDTFAIIYSGSETSFTDTTAESGVTYHYAVQARNEEGRESVLSEFDSGARAHSAGCAANLKAPADSDRFARLRNGFNDAKAIAARGGQLLVSDGDKIILLNRNRDTVGVWKGFSANRISIAGSTGSVYALADNKVYKLSEECGAAVVVALPPGASAATDLTLDRNENIYVSVGRYENAGRVFRFSHSGSLLNNWDFPDVHGGPTSPRVIHWDSTDDTLLIEMANAFAFKKYKVEADRLIEIGQRSQAIIGTIRDIVTQGNAIIAFVRSSEYTYRILYPTGLTGPAHTQLLSDRWQSNHIDAAVDGATGIVHVGDQSRRSLLSCAPPDYSCTVEFFGASPLNMTVDAQNNLYLLHGNPGLITKLNRNGAFVGSISLPDYGGSRVVPWSIESEGNSVLIAAANNDVQLIGELSSDLAAPVKYTAAPAPVIGLHVGKFSIAANPQQLVADRIEHDEDVIMRISKFVATAADGSKTKLPDLVLSENIFPHSSETTSCGNEGSLLHQVTAIDFSFNYHLTVARLPSGATGWQALPWQAPWWPGSPLEHLMTWVTCTRESGALMTLDQESNGVFSVAQRDVNLNEVSRFGRSSAALLAPTFSLQHTGDVAYAATSNEIYRFVRLP